MLLFIYCMLLMWQSLDHIVLVNNSLMGQFNSRYYSMLCCNPVEASVLLHVYVAFLFASKNIGIYSILHLLLKGTLEKEDEN